MLSYLSQGNNLAKIPIGILGSTSFFDKTGKSQEICKAIGKQIHVMDRYVCVTGGLGGVAEVTAKSVADQNRVYSVLPSCATMIAFGHGHVVARGYNMEERRTALAQMCAIYFMIEGGPGTIDEANKVLNLNPKALLLPIKVSGGASAGMFFEDSGRFFARVNERIKTQIPSHANELTELYQSNFSDIPKTVEQLFDILAKGK